MTEEESSTEMQLAGFIGYTALTGLKYAVPIILCTAISAKFIERMVLVIFKVGDA